MVKCRAKILEFLILTEDDKIRESENRGIFFLLLGF